MLCFLIGNRELVDVIEGAFSRVSERVCGVFAEAGIEARERAAAQVEGSGNGMLRLG